MVSTPSRAERVEAIRARVLVIKGLEGINPLLAELLDSIAKDVEWLCDNIENAWEIVEDYQKEIGEMYGDS